MKSDDLKRLEKKIKSAGEPKKKRKALWFVLKILAGWFVLSFFLPPFIRPVSGPITSPFFFRINPFTNAIEYHGGIDIGARSGTPVYASSLGIVAETGYEKSAGNYVHIFHAFGFSTFYAHLSSVRTGAWFPAVPYLIPIGTVGSTGASTGPHLHFEVRFLGIRIDPWFMTLFDTLRGFAFGY